MYLLRKRGRVWHVRFTIGRTRFERSTGQASKPRAVQVAQQIYEKQCRFVALGDNGAITFGEAVALYLSAGKPDRFLLPLMERLQHVAVADLSGEKLRRLAIELYPAAGPATRNRQVLTVAAAVINHAADQGFCAPVKVKRFAAPKPERRAGSWPWILAYQRQAEAMGKPALGALELLMFSTGARITQACRLTWADVDLAEAVAVLPPAKGHGRRPALLIPETVAAIANLATGPMPAHAKVFGFSSRHCIYKPRAAIIAAAGLEPLNPHEAGRHGFGTQMVVRAGMDPVTAARAGGWASARVLTDTYAHGQIDQAAIRAAFAKGKPPKAR